VKCWGHDGFGQLGDGRPDFSSSTPVDVVGLSSGVSSISAGGSHACAVLSSGAARCWGYNGFGGVGDGTTTDRTTPVNVLGLPSDVIAISAGDAETCALTTGHAAMCWGRNTFGELGDGSQVDRYTPVAVIGLGSGVQSVGGGNHSCALLSTGPSQCWGSNNSGQLGDGTTTNSSVPVAVVGATAATEPDAPTDVSATPGDGRATVTWSAPASDGGSQITAYTVTASSGGQSATVDGSTFSAEVTGLSNGTAYTFTVFATNAVGDGPESSASNEVTPSEPPPLQAFSTVSAGRYHTCALSDTNGVKCWGDNSSGKLGIGNWGTQSTTPQPVVDLSSGVASIAAGGLHTCALTTTGGVKCWGEGYLGELGTGYYGTTNTPADVVGLSTGVVAIATGYQHTCALTTAGAVKCWGYNGYGQLATGLRTTATCPSPCRRSAPGWWRSRSATTSPVP
jgi:alpha-tubulin suppressor-like RCC1 family protein